MKRPLELTHVLGVDPEVRLQRDVDADARRHITNEPPDHGACSAQAHCRPPGPVVTARARCPCSRSRSPCPPRMTPAFSTLPSSGGRPSRLVLAGADAGEANRARPAGYQSFSNVFLMSSGTSSQVRPGSPSDLSSSLVEVERRLAQSRPTAGSAGKGCLKP